MTTERMPRLGRTPALLAARRRIVAQRSPLVLVDGASGSGKSTFADLLFASWPGRPPELVRLDTIVPGWNGLEAGVFEMRVALLARTAARRAAITTWDWDADRSGAVRSLPPSRPVVVEGCGAFAAGAGLPALRIWIDLPDEGRRRRALARDDGGYDAFWSLWERQWRRHVRRMPAGASADLIVATPHA